MNEEFSTDIVIEALEILINHILYTRDVYPKEIFQKRRFYNCPVYVSVYPHLNEYLSKVLNIARALRTEKQLNRVEVLICKDQKYVYEIYAFEITNTVYTDEGNKDQYLMDLEEQLRLTLYTLSERLMPLGKLPEDAAVKLQLFTNQSSYIKICKDACEDIPWLQVSLPNQSTQERTTLPLMELTDCGVNIFVEKSVENRIK